MIARRPLTWFLVAATILFAGCAKYETEERDIGYLGKARLDPFLAATRLLEHYDYYVERTTSRPELPDFNTTIVLPAVSVGTSGRYMQWILNGGHVIYLASGYGNRHWETDTDYWTNDNEDHPLLAEFGLRLESSEGDTETTVRIRDHEYKVALETGLEIDISDATSKPDIFSGEDGSPGILSMPAGNGRLTVLTSAQPFRSRHIIENDHARLLFALLEETNTYSVIFTHGQATTFYSMLMHHAWMPLLGLSLLVVLWIWKNLPRFGPAIPHSDSGDRQFTEHLRMSGRFLWRNNASQALLAPVVAHIQYTLRKKHPHRDNTADADIDYFLENTDLPREQISEALLAPPVKDPATMTRISNNLKTLTEAL